jgi:hypothetical protein
MSEFNTTAECDPAVQHFVPATVIRLGSALKAPIAAQVGGIAGCRFHQYASQAN